MASILCTDEEVSKKGTMKIIQLLPSTLLLALSTTTAQQFNYEVEKRIVDNLNFYLGDPISKTEWLAYYYQNGGFPHNLQPPDRDEYAKLAYSLREPLIYYGLENGTNVG